MTTYHYDDTGRLTHATVEVEFDETEVEWFRALAQVRDRETCSLCGLPKKVCRDGKNEKKFTAEAERCFATAAINRQQEKDAAAKMPDPASLSYSVSFGG